MAQQGAIIPTSASSTFPGCALSCATLQQAQSVCLPPTQPESSQLVYDQCFCNSAFLTPFATTTDGVCVSECAILADRQQLQAWYNSFCAQVRQGIDPTTLTSTSQPGTTVATPTVTATSGTVIATVTATTPSNGVTPRPERSWIEEHWQWILMVVILIIGLGLLTWLAVWLKRRHRRKLEKQRAAASGFNYDPEKRPANDPRRSATPDLWGPHQMMQATKGYGYDSDEIIQEPEKSGTRNYRGAESSSAQEKDVIEFIEPESGKGVKVRPSNRRARPSELEINARMIGAADRRSKRVKSRGESPRPKDKEMEVEIPQPRKQRSRSKSKSKTKKASIDPEKT